MEINFAIPKDENNKLQPIFKAWCDANLDLLIRIYEDEDYYVIKDLTEYHTVYSVISYEEWAQKYLRWYIKIEPETDVESLNCFLKAFKHLWKYYKDSWEVTSESFACYFSPYIASDVHSSQEAPANSFEIDLETLAAIYEIPEVADDCAPYSKETAETVLKDFFDFKGKDVNDSTKALEFLNNKFGSVRYRHKKTGVEGVVNSNDNRLHFERCFGNLCSHETLHMDFVTDSQDWEKIE